MPRLMWRPSRPPGSSWTRRRAGPCLSRNWPGPRPGWQGEVVPNPGLLEENTFLVEYPSVVVGNFEDKFLALPDEVLITSMREHQRYFSLRGADGRLLPHFIAVNNTLTRNPDVVRQGHERVIRARLSDAMFFFQEDAKTPLANRVDALKGVVFHSLLGTSYEKMERFRELAVSLSRQLAPELDAMRFTGPPPCARPTSSRKWWGNSPASRG